MGDGDGYLNLPRFNGVVGGAGLLKVGKGMGGAEDGGDGGDAAGGGEIELAHDIEIDAVADDDVVRVVEEDTVFLVGARDVAVDGALAAGDPRKRGPENVLAIVTERDQSANSKLNEDQS